MIVINKLRDRRATKVQSTMNNQYVDATLFNSAALLSTAKDKIGRHNETYEDAMFMACVQGALINMGGIESSTAIVEFAKSVSDEAMRVHHGGISAPRELK